MREAEESLIQLREASVPVLITHLGKSDSADNRIGKVFRCLGGAAKTALRHVILRGAHQERCGALRALWEFEGDAATEVSLLLGYLDADDSEVRRRAAHCLGCIGPAARSAAEKLVHLAYDVESKVQFSALFALSQIGYDTKILAEVCFDVLESSDWERAQGALLILKRVVEDPSKVANRLLELLLRSTSTSYCLPLLDLLAACEQLPEEGPKTLEHFIRKGEIPTAERARAAQVLWKHTRDSELVLRLLEQPLITGEDLEPVCDTIAALGPNAAPLVPKLIRLVEENAKNWDVCWAIVDALGSIGPCASAAVPLLKQLQQHPSPVIQTRVQIALDLIQQSQQ